VRFVVVVDMEVEDKQILVGMVAGGGTYRVHIYIYIASINAVGAVPTLVFVNQLLLVHR
jgi:hypothetical protein